MRGCKGMPDGKDCDRSRNCSLMKTKPRNQGNPTLKGSRDERFEAFQSEQDLNLSEFDSSKAQTGVLRESARVSTGQSSTRLGHKFQPAHPCRGVAGLGY